MYTETRFIYLPADDEMVDASYKVLGGKRDVEIQCAPHAGGFGVNSYGYDDPKDEGSFYMIVHGIFRTLKAAKSKAIKVADAEVL